MLLGVDLLGVDPINIRTSKPIVYIKILSYFGDASDIDMAQAALHDCVVCEREVRPRQEALWAYVYIPTCIVLVVAYV